MRDCTRSCSAGLCNFVGAYTTVQGDSDAGEKRRLPLCREWWNPQSKKGTGPLHSMNVTRVQYIVR